jgi:hypothetical protein
MMVPLDRVTKWSLLSAILLAIATVHAASAQEASQREFERGYFLQTNQHDLAGASEAFEKVVADANAPASLRATAKTRLDQCREDLAACDFARLMPAETIAYVEITRPGRHIERLLRMTGLVRDPVAPPVDSESQGVSLGNGLFFPNDFSVSPALLGELNKLNGVAAALTSMDVENESMRGVVVLNPGNDNFLRGQIETAVQLLTPDSPIDGFKTYQIENEVWVTMTSRLVILSDSRETIAGTVTRLKQRDAKSLASNEQFQRCRADGGDALLFAYVSGQKLIDQFGSQLSFQEMVIARIALDLDHLESLTALVSTTDNGIRLEGHLNLASGHHNLAYGLIQTAPLTRRSLTYVPAGTAAVALLGLDSSDALARDTDRSGGQAVSMIGFGREIFGNMSEIALFVLPAADDARNGPPIPEIGLVLAVKDVTKTEALWSQLLALPSLFGAPGTKAPRNISIHGQSGKIYTFPDAPPIALVRVKDQAVIAGTEAAVRAAVAAGETASGICQDATFEPLVSRLGSTGSKVVLADAGRLLQTAASCQPSGRQAQELMMIGALLKDLRLFAVSEEGPTRLSLRVEAMGLPNVPEIIREVAR